MYVCVYVYLCVFMCLCIYIYIYIYIYTCIYVYSPGPKPPRNLHTLGHDTTSVEFAWDAPDQTVSVDSYRATVSKSDSPPADYVEHTSRRAESTNLTPGGTYMIKVRAVKNGVESTSTEGLRVTLSKYHQRHFK